MQNEPLFQARSKFNIFVRISIDIIPALCNAMAIGCVYMFFAMTNNAPLIDALKIFGIIILIATIIILSILIYLDHKNYNETFYNIYSDRIEIIKANLKQFNKFVYFKNVEDINYHNESLTQKIAKLGSIFFFTTTNADPIRLPDIENPEHFCKRIWSIIDKSETY